jgi:ankyrin repeat protein
MNSDLIRPFVIAAHGNLEAVRTMLAEHPDLLTVAFEWGPGDFEDGLGAAAMLGRYDDVKSFLDQDPNLANARGAHGISLMFHAAMSGDLELVKLLKSRGNNEGYSAALHGAISYGYTDVVAWLLDNGATDVNVPDYRGKTPLQSAEELGQAEVVELLKKHGAQ